MAGGNGQNDPVLWGPDGRPLSVEGALVAPNALNVATIIQNFGRMYPFRWDEAMRDAPQNALAMRRDSFYLSLVQERTAPTINLEWQVEVDDEDDPVQKLDADICNRGWREVPDKPGLFSWLLPATVWFGRAGQQGVWGRADSGLTNWLFHEPVHGDSIQFQWDNTPVVLTSWQTAQRIRASDPDAVITATDRGAFGLRLYKPEYRKRFVIHKHVREASDYFEGEMSGGVHGVGLRSWAYWNDYMRRDLLAGMTGFMSSTGMMDLICFNFPEGNAAAQAQAEKNAKQISGKLVLICPRDPAKDWPAIEQYPMNTAGVECVRTLIDEYYDRHTRELFVGQNMSNGGGGPGGLEGDGRAELAGDTKFQLCKTDALRLGETLTRDWLIPFRDFNRPGSTTPMRMVPVLDDPKAERRVQNAQIVCSLGVKIEEEELRKAAGFKTPRPGKPTVGGKDAAGGMPGAGPPGTPPGPGQPPKPGEGGRATSPPEPKPPSDPKEFFALYRAAKPPFDGGVFNEQSHRWEKKEDAAGSGRATAQQKPDLSGDDHPIALKPDVAGEMAAGIDGDVADWPAGEPPPDAGLVAKAKDVALTVAAKAYVWAAHATHSKAMGYLADVMEAVFDTPADMMKLGYNPNTTSGTANPQVLDPVRDATGVSGHLVASIASKVLVKAAFWVGGRLRNKPDTQGYDATQPGAEPDGYGEWAAVVHAVFERVNEQMGGGGQVPDVATIERNLRMLVKGHEDRFQGFQLYADAAGKVWKEIEVHRGGKVFRQKRLVRTDHGQPRPDKKQQRTDSHAHVQAVLSDPAKLTHADVEGFAKSLSTLTHEQLKPIRQKLKTRAGRKQEVVDALVEWAKARIPPPPDGTPARPLVARPLSGEFKPAAFATADPNPKAKAPNVLLPQTTRPQLSIPEQAAVAAYTGGDYAKINADLRAGGDRWSRPDLAHTHDQLQSAFAKAPVLSEPVEVYRGVDLSEMPNSRRQQFLAGLKRLGGVVKLNGYTSTTTDAADPYAAESDVKVTIRAKHGLDVKPYSHKPQERELLLNHASRFRVVGYEQRGKQHQVILEQVV